MNLHNNRAADVSGHTICASGSYINIATIFFEEQRKKIWEVKSRIVSSATNDRWTVWEEQATATAAAKQADKEIHVLQGGKQNTGIHIEKWLERVAVSVIEKESRWLNAKTKCQTNNLQSEREELFAWQWFGKLNEHNVKDQAKIEE